MKSVLVSTLSCGISDTVGPPCGCHWQPIFSCHTLSVRATESLPVRVLATPHPTGCADLSGSNPALWSDAGFFLEFSLCEQSVVSPHPALQSALCLVSASRLMGRPVLRPHASLQIGLQTWVCEAALTHHPGQNGSGMVMWSELSHLDTLSSPRGRALSVPGAC